MAHLRLPPLLLLAFGVDLTVRGDGHARFDCLGDGKGVDVCVCVSLPHTQSKANDIHTHDNSQDFPLLISIGHLTHMQSSQHLTLLIYSTHIHTHTGSLHAVLAPSQPCVPE